MCNVSLIVCNVCSPSSVNFSQVGTTYRVSAADSRCGWSEAMPDWNEVWCVVLVHLWPFWLAWGKCGESVPCRRLDEGDHTERLACLEAEQEQLNSSLLALTTHFAQVQFRLKQIVSAEPNLKEVGSDLAWKSLPDCVHFCIEVETRLSFKALMVAAVGKTGSIFVLLCDAGSAERVGGVCI